jgi:hypothetical protein
LVALSSPIASVRKKYRHCNDGSSGCVCVQQHPAFSLSHAFPTCLGCNFHTLLLHKPLARWNSCALVARG